MKNEIPYWGVVLPDFLKIGNFSKAKVKEARCWCIQNCKGKFITSDICPWAFLIEQDAINFQKIYGGFIQFKDKEV